MRKILLKIISSLPLAILAVFTFLNDIFSQTYSYPNKYVGYPLPMRHHFYLATEKTYKNELMAGNMLLNFFLWLVIFFLLLSFLEIIKKFKRVFLTCLSFYLSLLAAWLSFFLARYGKMLLWWSGPKVTNVIITGAVPPTEITGIVRGWPLPFYGTASTPTRPIEDAFAKWSLLQLLFDILFWFVIFLIINIIAVNAKKLTKYFLKTPRSSDSQWF